MIDLAAGDVRLRRRLEAYADRRLSPDFSATSRMRARVLAHAHRHADRARADVALTVIPPMADARAVGRRRGGRRMAVSLVAAALLFGAGVGGAAASSGPGGALYDVRLWAETVTLPSDPSARAVAELSRLTERLREADVAARNGDLRAAAAALTAYEQIMGDASTAVVAANDPVAAAALEAGIGGNVAVLQALIGRVPAQAGVAISSAVERAIARSNGALHSVEAVDRPSTGGGNTGGGTETGGSAGSGGNAGNGNGGGSGAGTDAGGPEATPKPPKTPRGEPAATPKPTRTDRPEATPKPTRTPKPAGQAPGAPPPNDPPN